MSLNIYLLTVHVREECHGVHVGIRGQLLGVSSFLHSMGPWKGTEVIRLGRKYLSSLSHLAYSCLLNRSDEVTGRMWHHICDSGTEWVKAGHSGVQSQSMLYHLSQKSEINKNCSYESPVWLAQGLYGPALPTCLSQAASRAKCPHGFPGV